MEPSRISRHSAVAGTAIWIGWQLLADVFAPVALLVLSPLVLVPLLLAAIDELDTPLMRALTWAQLPCALPLPLALSLKPGAAALLACLPWAGWTALAAFEGARRIVAMVRAGGVRGLYDSELAIAAGLGFPVIGSAWLAADRLALEPLGFSPLIVLLTAVHFHHAGLSLPLSAGLVGRASQGREPWRTAAVGVVVAVPLVAIGITASPLLEVASAWLTAACAGVVGIGMLDRSRDRSLAIIPALLFAISSACLLAAMVFAASYSIGEFRGSPWPDITAMFQLHGAVNALGFGLLGAWAWRLAPPPTPAAARAAPKPAPKPEPATTPSGEP